MRMRLAATLAVVPLQAKDNDSVVRLAEASAVFSEVMATPDKGTPEEMLANAQAGTRTMQWKTAAFLVSGKYGKGYVSCRSKTGPSWFAPGTVPN